MKKNIRIRISAAALALFLGTTGALTASVPSYALTADNLTRDDRFNTEGAAGKGLTFANYIVKKGIAKQFFPVKQTETGIMPRIERTGNRCKGFYFVARKILLHTGVVYMGYLISIKQFTVVHLTLLQLHPAYQQYRQL